MVRAVAVVLFLVCTLLGSPPPAAAAPPGNDAFAQATPLQGDQPITVEGSTAEATKEPGEPAHAGNAGGASVWFAWTPAISAEVDIATCSSGFDTLLAVYTGATLDTLVLAVANDDACDLASRVGLDVVAGTTYAIAVDGFGGAAGPFTLTIENAPERPANDDFADAQTLTGALPITVTASTDTATSEPGEPLHGEFNSTAQRSVWYRWTANLTGPLVVDTCDIVGPEGTTYQSALAVYIGDALAGLTQLEADAGECQGFWARLTFDADAGTTYSIAVDGYLGDSGTARLTLRTGAPPNDNIASAQVLPPDGGVTVAGSTAGATRQQFEPDPADGSFSTEGSPTIWYAWSPAVSGRVRIDTCGSAVNTTVTVWAGVTWATPPAPPSGFDVVASNSSYCGLQGGVNVEVAAGSEYRIVVAGAGFPLEEGPVVLSIAEPGAAPANDDLAGAAALPSRLPVVAYGTSVDATAEPGEALHGADVPPASVWYTWRAEQSGVVAVDTCRSSIAATFAVYTGDTAAVLTPVVQGRRTCLANGRAQFAAVAGSTYSIAVADRGGGQGAFRLQLRAAARPGNDDFAAASVLPARLPVSVGGSIVDATFEPGEPPDYTANGLGSSVWYRWTPAVTGEVVVNSCGSQLQTALGIWTGTSVSALTPAAGQQIFGCDGGVSVRFPAVAGTTYHLSADGVFGRFTVDGDDDEGRVRLAVAVAPPRRPPANDALTGAVDLGTVLPARANTKTTDATAEPTDPIMLGSAGERASTTSVWFRWTAPVTAPVVVDTCASTYRTQINVGTQDAGGVLLPIPREQRTYEPFGCNEEVRYRFTATAGTAYWIAVGGDSGAAAQQEVRLLVRLDQPPTNDSIGTPQDLGSRMQLRLDADNTDATRAADEPSFGAASATLWYAWTPRRSDDVVLDTCHQGISAAVALFELTSGTPVAVAGQETGCADGGLLRVSVLAGTRYLVGLGSDASNRGPVRLVIRPPDEPRNDDAAAASELRTGRSVSGLTTDATTEAGEPAHGGLGVGATVWYRWIAPATTLVAIDTCASAINTTMAVYVGTPISDLRLVAADGDSACNGQSLVVFSANAGTTYWVAVDGAANSLPNLGAAGDVRLTVRVPDSEGNWS